MITSTCSQGGLRLSDTPHLSGVNVTAAGSGYAYATVTFSPKFHIRAHAVIVGGAIDSIVLDSPGRGVTSIPTITIDGDGTGATAEVKSIIGGAELHENITRVPDHGLGCPGYSEEPVAPDTVDVCICGDNEFPPDCDDCVNTLPDAVENTFQPYDPPQYKDYSSCKKRGFKVVYALAPWAGYRGYTDCGDYKELSQTKYLVETYTHTWKETYAICDESECDWQEFTVEKSFTRTTTKSVTGGPDVIVTSGTELDGEGNAIDFGTIPVDAWLGGCEPDTTLYRDCAGRAFTVEKSLANTLRTYSRIGKAAEGYGCTITGEVDLETCLNVCSEICDERPNPCGFEHTCDDGAWTGDSEDFISYELSDENTAEKVNEMADDLLDTWDLCDDIQIPWREDGSIGSGPLVTYDQNGELVGAPTDDTAEKFWANNFPIFEWSTTCDDTNACWRNTKVGKWLNDHRTWEMPPKAYAPTGLIYPGAVAIYNSPLQSTPPCGTPTGSGPDYCSIDVYFDAPLFPNMLLKSKWAEIYLFEFSHQNPARPCGDDRNTIDPDSVDCDEESPTYNPTGDLAFPSAAETCSEKDTMEGSYSVKSWHYKPLRGVTFNGLVDGEPYLDPCGNTITPQVSDGFDIDGAVGALDSMSCSSGTVAHSPCRPTAVFIQQNAPTGIYEGSLHLAGPGDIALREDCLDCTPDGCGAYSGEFKLVQFQQAKVDPFWRRPVSCVEGNKVYDEDALPDLLENDDCENDNCEGYNNNTGSTFKANCEPSELKPWLVNDEGGDWF